MKKTNYSPLLRTKSLPGLLTLIFLAASCVPNRSLTDSSSIPSVARASKTGLTEFTGAAAQSGASVRDASQREAPDEADLLAANVPAKAANSKQVNLKQKLVGLRAQLEKTRAAPAPPASAKGTPKIFLPTKLLINKLLKKSNRRSERPTSQINDVKATQASGNNLVLVGLLLVIIGLLLALLATEGSSLATVGLIALVAGLVLAVIGLVA
ncbi:MAG: hypothetical protein H7Z75_13330 [Ferruginibacter sp.]|nr:hypothetical protein [Cytophagales bacterium]